MRRRNPAVSVHRPITRADYPAIFGDHDRDGIPDVDDPRPHTPGDRDTIEEVRLSDELGALVDLRADFEGAKERAMDALRRIGGPYAKVKGRVKSPFSVINKLRRKRLLGAKGITDMAGVMVVVLDAAEVERVRRSIEGGALGRVLEREDFYVRPLDGYRAHHYIVEVGDLPVEVQLKSARMAAIAGASHTPYKSGRLNGEEMAWITELVHEADRGNMEAAAEVDALLRDEHALEQRLTR